MIFFLNVNEEDTLPSLVPNPFDVGWEAGEVAPTSTCHVIILILLCECVVDDEFEKKEFI